MVKLIGHILIKEVEISVGWSKIDKHYGEWLHIWNELSQTVDTQVDMLGRVEMFPV